MNDTDGDQNTVGPDLLRVVGAATAALSDPMVDRLAALAGGLLEMADQLNRPETREALSYTLERLTDLHRVGATETVFALLETVHCARMAMTDPIINRLSGLAEHVISNLGNEEMVTLLGEVFAAVQDAVVATRARPQGEEGLFATLKLLTKPETQQTLRFVLTVAEKIQERSGSSGLP